MSFKTSNQFGGYTYSIRCTIKGETRYIQLGFDKKEMQRRTYIARRLMEARRILR